MISTHIANKEKNKKRNCSSGKKSPISPSRKSNYDNEQKDDVLYLNYLSIFKIDKIPSNYVYIQELYLSHNMLRNLQGIEQFKSLRVLHLKFNFIVDFYEIDRIVNKFYLKNLSIQGNPIMKIEKNRLTFSYLKANHFENLTLFNSEELDPPFMENQQKHINGHYDTNNKEFINVNERQKKEQCQPQAKFDNKGKCLRGYSSQRDTPQSNDDLLKFKCNPQKLLQKRHESLLSTVSANQQFVEKQKNFLNEAKINLNKTTICQQNFKQNKLDIQINNNEIKDSRITPLKRQASTNSSGSMSRVFNQMDASLHNKSSSRLINNFFEINDKINQDHKNFQEFEVQCIGNFNQNQEDNYFDSEENNNDDLNKYLQDQRKQNKNHLQNNQNLSQKSQNPNKSIPIDQYADMSELINSEREKSLENIRQLKKNVSQVQLELQNLQKNLFLQNNIEQIVQNINSVQSQLSTTHKLTSNSLKSGQNQHLSNIQNSIYLNGNLTNRSNRQQSSNNQQTSQQSHTNNNITNTIEANSKENNQTQKNNYFQLVINHQKQSRVSQQKHTFQNKKIHEKEYLDEDIPLKFENKTQKTTNKSNSLIKQQSNRDLQFIQNEKQSQNNHSQLNYPIKEESNDQIGKQQNKKSPIDIEQMVSSPVQNRRQIGFIKHISKDTLINQQQNNKQSEQELLNRKSPCNINNEQQQITQQKNSHKLQKFSSLIPQIANNNNGMLSDNRDYIKNKPLITSNIINGVYNGEINKKQQLNNLQMINEHLKGKQIQKQQNQDFNNLYSNIVQEQCQTKRQINLQSIIQNNQGKENAIDHQRQSPRLLQQPKIQNQKQYNIQQNNNENNNPKEEQVRNNSQLKSFINNQQQKTFNQNITPQYDSMNQQQYTLNNQNNSQNDIQQKISSNTQNYIINDQHTKHFQNLQQNIQNFQQQNIQNNYIKSNSNQIDFSNNYMVQPSIHKKFNSLTGEQSQRIAYSKSQYINNKRNVNEQNGQREYNSQISNCFNTNSNHQKSHSIAQNISHEQMGSLQHQISHEDNLIYQKSNSNLSNQINTTNYYNFQINQKQSASTPLKLSYYNNPQLNIQDTGKITNNIPQQKVLMNVQNSDIQKQNLNQQYILAKQVSDQFNQVQNERKNQLQNKNNSNTQSTYSSTQQCQVSNKYMNYDQLSQNLQSFGSTQHEIFEQSHPINMNRSNSKGPRQEYLNEEYAYANKEYTLTNDVNTLMSDRKFLENDRLQFVNCGMQQLSNDTVTSNLAEQLQISMNNLEKQNLKRNSLVKLNSNSKSVNNLIQNNFVLKSSGSVGELLNTELQSPSSTANQIIHVNQLLSSSKKQNYSNNQFNPNQLYLFGSDIKNNTMNYQNLNSYLGQSPDIKSSKQEIFENTDRNSIVQQGKMQSNPIKNSEGKSLLQNNQLIHVQNTFTFEDRCKIYPQKVIEVDEESQSQNNNIYSSDSITQINEESQDEKDDDILTTNTLLHRKPTCNSINQKNPLSFSRLNTFSQHDNEMEEDILTINNINNISNQLKQQNSNTNIELYANCDTYQNLTNQQNQYLQQQQKFHQINNQEKCHESQQKKQMNLNFTPLKVYQVQQNLQYSNAQLQQDQETLQSSRKSIQKNRELSAQKQQNYNLSGSSQNLVDKHIDDIDNDIQTLAIKYSNRTLINKVFKSLRTSIQSTIKERRAQQNNDKALMFYYRALKVKSFYSWKSYIITKQTYRKAIQKINFVKEIQNKIGNE